MVAKLLSKNVVCFHELRKRCPKNQIHHLDNFWKKRQQYQERLRTSKKDVPFIDWEYYKRNVRSEYVEMVEEFEKKYTSYCVPYPKDNHSQKIDKIKADLEIEVAEYIKKSNERIAEYERRIATLTSMLPFDQMTWEDYCILYPKEAPDFLNRPTFWPHDVEEQIDNEENDGSDGNDGNDGNNQNKTETKRNKE